MNGNDIIKLGFESGPHIPKMLEIAKTISNASKQDVYEAVKHLAPPPKLKLSSGLDFYVNIKAESDIEQSNIDAVTATMNQLMRTPMIKAGAVMPDACPAGPLGTIPVGGVVASEAIHPGMHSADVCCSMAISTFSGVSPKQVLDVVNKVTHFGVGGRDEFFMSKELSKSVLGNPYLEDFFEIGNFHMGTQGDGNHFAFVGTLKSTGETTLVTHHGSRAFGAKLYKKGMSIAEKFRQKLSPETKKQNAWIPTETKEFENYWSALQIVRLWTKENHLTIHNQTARVLKARIVDQFWNEHNFVFQKSDGLFYHAKGATPAFENWANDSTGLTLIPLNMTEPILITKGKNAINGLGFSPHGSGRNYSRTHHKKINGDRPIEEIFKEETKNIDARFYSGKIDISELPSAYKNADTVKSQISEFGLAEIVDQVLPYGCIMAGEFDTPWRINK